MLNKKVIIKDIILILILDICIAGLILIEIIGYLVLIGANGYFSIIKGSTFLNKITGELKEQEGDNSSAKSKRKINDMEHIKKSLWIYPLTSGILWVIFFIIQILFNETEKRGFLSWVYCILISIRQGIYTFIFVYTQKDIKYQFMRFILCKNRKRKIINLKKSKGIINPIKKKTKKLLSKTSFSFSF